MRKFYLGCAVWGYKGWLGDLFPSGSRSTNFLRLYSERLTTVEGNTTFYSTPDPQTIARWVSETPPGFKFCPKLPRSITHQGLLKPLIPNAQHFIDLMQGLGDRLGPIFAQLPPTYGPDRLQDLAAFLTAWPVAEVPLALEVRHPEWFESIHAESLNAILTDLQVGRVVLDTRPIYECDDHPQLQSERRKPQLPVQTTVTASFVLVRFISHPQRHWNQSYLQAWTESVDRWLKQDLSVYFFVHCPTEDYSPGTARYFQDLLAANQVVVPSLPWNELSNLSETQLTLF
jgi:uncharacterized protein YecE (DUF72 family)